MNIDREFLELVRNEIKTGIESFSQEVKNSFAELSQIMSAGFTGLSGRIDQTNIRLDACIDMTRDFRKDVSGKLDGIGDHLLGMNGSLVKQEQRINALEQRVNRLEDAS